MTDPLRVYADLYHQAIECRRRVDAIRQVLSRAVETLEKRPERFRFDGFAGVPAPAPQGEALAEGDWPTAAQLQQIMADWHATGAQLIAAWEALWPRDRELLSRLSPESANIPRPLGHSSRRGAAG